MSASHKLFTGAALAALLFTTSASAIEITNGQILGDDGGDIGQSLADSLFLNVPGLTITSTTISGASPQFGTFTNATGTYGLPSQGIVLSTGNVSDYEDGENTDSGNTTDFETFATPEQEALLDPITGGGFDHFDVAQLTIEFDAGPDVDSVTFFGTFGSEEFPEFVGSEFIDGFGLFVNGQNVAFSGGDPINVNHPDFIGAFNPEDDFPIDDEFGDGVFLAEFEDGEGGPIAPNNSLEPGDPRLALVTGTELDGVIAPGVNPVLRFDVPVNPDSSNVFEIIIADTSDNILDTTIYLSSFLPTEVNLNDGSTEFTPLLPGDPDPQDGIFVFDLPDDLDLGEIFFIDPPVSVGYTYSVTDAEFALIQAPSLATIPDPDGYQILADGQVFNLLPGQIIDISALNVSEFTLLGIDPSLLLDPDNPLAFPLGVSLQNVAIGADPQISQQAITEEFPPTAAVPLPGGLPLYLAGIAVFFAFRRFRSH